MGAHLPHVQHPMWYTGFGQVQLLAATTSLSSDRIAGPGSMVFVSTSSTCTVHMYQVTEVVGDLAAEMGLRLPISP